MPAVVETDVKGTTSVHVRRELGYRWLSISHDCSVIQNERHTDGGLSFISKSELNDTASLGAMSIKQDLGEFNVASRLEQFDQVLVRSRPRQLMKGNIEPSERTN